MTKAIETLLSAINDLVREGGTWQEKRDKVLSECSDDDKTNLAEFLGWFDGVDV